MKLILAIDIRKEKVVKAYAGFRLNYKKLLLNNNDFSCPLIFINTVIEKFKINTIYIADLDAYIQALRDVTSQSDPYNITWPTLKEE